MVAIAIPGTNDMREERRLQALDRYDTDDAEAAQSFERIVRIATALLDCPVGLISLFERRRQAVKAGIGTDVREYERGETLCERLIQGDADYLVAEAPSDRTAGHDPPDPLSYPFYAGTVLRSPDGFNLGTLCVLDHRPRPDIGEKEARHLMDLGRMLVADLERRRALSGIKEKERRLNLLNDINIAIARAPTFVDAFKAMLVLITDGMEADLGLSWSISGDGDCTMGNRYERTPSDTSAGRSAQWSLQVDRSLADLAIRQGHSVFVSDASTLDPAAFATARHCAANGLCAVLTVPVATGPEPFGLTLLFRRPPKDPSSLVAWADSLRPRMESLLRRSRMEEENDLLRSVVIHANDAILITGPQTLSTSGPRILYANPAFVRMSGYAADEMIGKSPRLFQGPETSRAELDRIRNALHRRVPVKAELVNYRKDGGEYWVEMDIVPVMSTTGQVSHFISVQRDITERRRLVEALAARETQFRGMFENNPIPMWVFDSRTDRFLAVNEAAITHYGYDERTFLRMTARDIEAERETSSAATDMEAPPAPGRPRLVRHRKADGSVIDMETSSHSIEVDGRAATLVAGIDVTARLAAERSLRRNEDRMRVLARQKTAILDALPIHVALLDETGTVVTVNRSWREFGFANGYEDKAVGVGLNYIALCEQAIGPCARDAAIMARGLRTVLGNVSTLFSFDYQCDSPTEERWYRAVAAPISDGETTGAVVMHINITSSKIAERTIDEARLVAESASRTKTEFLANMSHELRTPLNAIIGFSDLLLNGYGGTMPERQQEYVTNIMASGRHLLSIVNDVLDISRIEFGRIELNPVTVDLCAALRSCLTLIAVRAKAGDVTLTADPYPDVVILDADETRLKQIFLNLLSNAVKFTEPGGSVTVSTRRMEGTAVVEIADTGVGMNEKEIEIALRPFGQVDTTLARRYDGTGLGLTIAKSLIELHGGTLTIDSSKGRGTTVKVSLPMVRDGVPRPIG